MSHLDVRGFVPKPKRTAGGGEYGGRFVCRDVTWVGSGQELLATFTITAGELADAAENGIVWTDQDVQRGIQPTAFPKPEREILLSAGYPDVSKYVFDAKNADEIVDKLLTGAKLFLSPLIWNLRPGQFEAHWQESKHQLFLYSGKIYLPDSHHRQQAILKAVRLWRDSKRSYPKFHEDKQFKIELYFLDREDEGNYFFDKNQRPKPTAKSKAFDLTTVDDLSLLAKKVIDASVNLTDNVNRVTDRLTRSNPHVITLSTLREMMKTFAPGEELEASEVEGMAVVAAKFYDMLADVRPELGRQSQTRRKSIREDSLVDAAVMMHGYAALLKDFNESFAFQGTTKATKEWESKLKRLAPSKTYRYGRWDGDLFDKRNPLWQAVGVVKPGRGGSKLTVINTGGARFQSSRILRSVVSGAVRINGDLKPLATE